VGVAHREPAYSGHPHGELPQSELANTQTLYVPLFHNMTEAEISTVLEGFAHVAEASKEGRFG
jgi:perosamine synthetase